MDTRELIHTALLVSVCVALGYLVAVVPNVELISVAIFTAGTLKGVRRGALIGALAEGIYAGVNPYGVSPLPLLLSQILGMSVLGAAGGVFARHPAQVPAALQAVLAGACGLVLTLFYDVLTNSAGYLLVRETTPYLAYMIAGLSFPFPLAHALGNTISFALVVPGVRRATRRWSPA
ncbi:MAG TPA: hypothetical protein VFE28_02780 [Candidatus Krumholzibacteria bacterium]|nr:hypothetical protein [Candidatus Krumholzibacteria bacterium]